MEEDRKRDRTPFALLELAAAVLLVGAGLLPWFERGTPGFTDELTAWNAVDGGVLLVLPPMFAAASALVGCLFAGRSRVANPIAFVAAGIQPAFLLLAPSLIEPQSSTPITSAYGLWIEFAAAIFGLAMSLADFALAGPVTLISRLLGRPSMVAYVALAVIAIVATYVVWLQSGDAAGFSFAVVMLVAVTLAAPRWQVRLLVAAIAIGLFGAWFMAQTQPLTAAVLVFVAIGALAMLLRERSRRRTQAAAAG